MELIVRRGQKSGMLSSKIIFTLSVRAKLTEEEAANVQKYKLSSTVLYKNYEIEDRGSGLLGLASRMAIKSLNTHITVGSLMEGINLECKDVVEMLAIEEQIIEASELFKQVLDASTLFGGEEVISFDGAVAAG
ncbi:hypothetical protein [Kordiimonas pumila]|uniref:Uncharacterized protein n=1 Tax=Kordiimonas pumila TaxID=2161677 RepID=A0ABV7D8F9_9PROT|nr:hypothetical protein [Kordiimonas pumila]